MLTLGDSAYHLRVADGELEIGREPVADPDVAVETDPDTYSAIMQRQLGIDDAIASGALQLDGSRDAFEAILGTVAPPVEAPAAEAAEAV